MSSMRCEMSTPTSGPSTSGRRYGPARPVPQPASSADVKGILRTLISASVACLGRDGTTHAHRQIQVRDPSGGGRGGRAYLSNESRHLVAERTQLLVKAVGKVVKEGGHKLGRSLGDACALAGARAHGGKHVCRLHVGRVKCRCGAHRVLSILGA
eukprot:scaffold31296_cov27-Tisochrysis_lutea.AAC.1